MITSIDSVRSKHVSPNEIQGRSPIILVAQIGFNSHEGRSPEILTALPKKTTNHLPAYQKLQNIPLQPIEPLDSTYQSIKISGLTPLDL
jgi:hypothetical protein